MQDTTHNNSSDNLGVAASYEETMQTLEKQIDHLATAFSELKQKNEILGHRQTDMEKERAALVTRHHQAQKKLESLISKLKSMEGS